MRFVLRPFAAIYVWVWWQAHIDPSGYVRPTSRISSIIIVVTISSAATLSLFETNLGASNSSAGYEPKPAASASRKVTTQKLNAVSSSPVQPITGSLLSIYQDAAKQCGMEWETLAAVGWVESHHGTLQSPGVRNGSNFAGAKGPMQFLSTTWTTYGVDADENGTADVYNSKDAIFGAARYLCANGANNPAMVRNALWHYNHSNEYVNEVLAVARKYKTTPPTPSTQL